MYININKYEKMMMNMLGKFEYDIFKLCMVSLAR